MSPEPTLVQQLEAAYKRHGLVCFLSGIACGLAFARLLFLFQ